MTFILRRLLALIPTLIGVSMLTFFLIRMTPGDPAKLVLGPDASPEQVEAKRKELGLDKPLIVQYFIYMVGNKELGKKGVIHGDLGDSITYKDKVSKVIFRRLPATIELALFSICCATITSLLVGVTAAAFARGWIDTVSRAGILIFLAMPSFWLGLEMIILFSRKMHFFPPSGRGEPFTFESLSYLFLPSLVLGLGSGAYMSGVVRASMLEVLSSDFIRTARAKGVSGVAVVCHHALRNALIPFVTLVGVSLGSMLGGSVVAETVFSWPGAGRLLVESIKERDFPMTTGCVIVLATIFVLVNTAVDMLYGLIDPRIRVAAGAGDRTRN